MFNLPRDLQRLQDHMRSLETSTLAFKLAAHYRQREHENLLALTRKWIKEHQ